MELKDIITDGISLVESFVFNTGDNYMIDLFHSWIKKEWKEVYSVNAEESLDCSLDDLKSILDSHLTPRNKLTLNLDGIKHRNFDSVLFIEYRLESNKELRVGILNYCDNTFCGLDLYCNAEGKEFLEKLISQ